MDSTSGPNRSTQLQSSKKGSKTEQQDPSADKEMAKSIPDNLLPENYTVLRRLGHGAFGEVFKCYKTDTKQTVAVKVLRKEHQKDGKPREVEIMEKLGHLDPNRSNIVRFHEWFQNNNQACCMVYELLDKSLFDYLNSTDLNTVPLPKVRTIIRDLATALADLHKAGVIHGDIKTDNIMLVDAENEPFRVKLIDFGMALHKDKVRRGMRIQPLWHRSPEVIVGRPFTEAIDVWCLGTVVADLLMGSPVFQANNEYNLLRCIIAFLGNFPQNLLDNGLYTDQFYNYHQKYFILQEWRLKTPLEFFNATGTIVESQEVSSFTIEHLKMTNLQKHYGIGTAEWRACVDLLEKMLQMDHEKRITPSQILAHPFMTENYERTSSAHPQAVLDKTITCKTSTDLSLESLCDFDTTDDSGVEVIAIAESVNTSSYEALGSVLPASTNTPVESSQPDVSEPRKKKRNGISRFFSALKRRFSFCCRVNPEGASSCYMVNETEECVSDRRTQRQRIR